MSVTTTEYEIQVRNADQWDTIVWLATREEAEAALSEMSEKPTRIIEVQTRITRRIIRARDF